MNQAAHGLTTIAAIPSTGGAGMALRGETNTPRKTPALAQIGTGSHASLRLLLAEIEREREAWDMIGRTAHGWLCTCRLCGVTRECDALLCRHDL